ncbi:TonB-dependent receptor [Pseudomaricurvus alkylphenolicus]|uniref:TonB-dependent receptor n=1 Tax=Pseudomaricurvus alkylphenolicus TaxID=1306991 RepID=UPI00141EB3CC|nr:TonB-dependent receptor [Pseudomaricurvus alkylphenolicus]NIB44676.1 TonB-dependent receptor [Pseudomaricurvus alkylphenolicus]
MNRSCKKNYKLSLAIAAITSSVSFTAVADDTNFVLEEVIVTAQKRAQSLQDVPMSVSAVTGEKMTEAGVADLGDMSAYVPNFQMADLGFGQLLVVRGIGSGANAGFEQSVVQYMDDIALGRSALSVMPFMDLERVEVLRGPQNVLFGKNSIAGALSSTTAKPTEEFEASLGVEYQPKDNAQTLNAMVSGALTDGLRARLVVRDKESDGFYKNNLTGQDEGGSEEQAIRLTLGFDINSNIDATLKLENSTVDFFNGIGNEVIAGYTGPLGTYPQTIDTLAATGALLGAAKAGGAINAGNYPVTSDLYQASWDGSLPSGGFEDGTADRRRNTNLEEHHEYDVDNATFTLNWDLGGVTMTSVTGYAAYDTDVLFDTDTNGIDTFSSARTAEEYDQFSQEIRFVSPGGETLDWIAGVYYQQWDLEYSASAAWGLDTDIGVLGASLDALSCLTDPTDAAGSLAEIAAGALGCTGAALGGAPFGFEGLGALAGYSTERRYKGESETYAIFAQATWNVSEALRVTLGGRYTEEEKSAQKVLDLINSATGTIDPTDGDDFLALTAGQIALNGDLNSLTGHDLDKTRTERSFTPTLMVEWDYSGDTLFYATLGQGFKAGGFDALTNSGSADIFEYEDETVLSGELGAKLSLAGGAAHLNLALFYSEYDDMQVSVFDGVVGVNVGNAGQSVSQGVELDGRWRVSEGLTLSGSMAYLDFEFKEYEGATCPASNPASSCDLKGEENIYTPSLAASVSADYVMPVVDGIDLRSTLDLNYSGEQFVEATMDPLVKQGAATKVNLRIALEAEQWTLALLGKNLTDKDTYNYIAETPLTGLLGLGATSYTGFQDAPRTVALQANYRF